MIVCTGGTGTIGQFLPASVVRLRTRLEDSVESHVAELRALPAKPEVLIHLAALTSVSEAESDPSRAQLLNVDGAKKWFLAAEAAGIRKFIFVSTSHVFKPTSERKVLTTDRQPDAVTVYGKSKALAEKELRDIATDSKTKLVVARVFSVTSPKMREGFLFPELLRRARVKDFKSLPGHQNVRDFIDAQEAANRLLKLADSSARLDPIVHIGSGVAKSVRELAEEVMSANGVDKTEMAAMFTPTSEPPNFLISETLEGNL